MRRILLSVSLRSLGLCGLVWMGTVAGAQVPPVAGAVGSAPLQVAMTFDDLPAHGPLPPGMARPAVVASILKTLKAEKMPPVYGFINGVRVREYPYQIHILEAWAASGNPLGNHTMTHPELDRMTPQQYEADIADNEPLLRRLEPHGDWHWFRYPFLEEGDTIPKREAVRDWLQAHDYRIAEVSMDFQDYLWNEPYARCSAQGNEAAIQQLHDSYLATADQYIRVYRKLAQTLYGRDIPYVLLMHVGAFDARMLPELIGLFRQRGFAFVPMPQALADPAYKQDPEVPVPGGSTFNEMVATVRKAEIPDAQEPDVMLAHLCR